MSITFISAKKALNSAFFKLPVLESEIQKLSKNLEIYINSAKDGEYEEYHKVFSIVSSSLLFSETYLFC